MYVLNAKIELIYRVFRTFTDIYVQLDGYFPLDILL